MEIEQKKELVRKLYEEVVSGGDLDWCDQFFAPDIIENEAVPGGAPGIEGFKQTILAFRAGFPDFKFRVDDIFAEDDKVVCRMTFKGTHENNFLGIEPCGKTIEFETIDIIRFEGDLMAEHWGRADMLGFLQQMHALPETETLVAGQ